MRNLSCVALVAAALLCVTPALMAQSQLQGKKAPDFTVGDTINEAPAKSLTEMSGEVILIKYWGTR